MKNKECLPTSSKISAVSKEKILVGFSDFVNRYQIVKETTSERFVKYMENAHWNTSIFQEKTLLLPMDYCRLYQNHKFKISSYISMAVGLGLTVDEITAALSLSGLGLDKNNPSEFAYIYILSNYHGCSIDEFNDILKILDVTPLGSKSRK